MINFVMWVVLWALLGWLAGQLMRTRSETDMMMNVGAGIIGAMAGGWLISPAIYAPLHDSIINAPATMIAFFGAIVLISVVNVLRHRAQY